MRKTTGPAARKVSEWQDLTCWVVGLNQRADFYEVVGSSIGNIYQFLDFEFISLDKIPFFSILQNKCSCYLKGGLYAGNQNSRLTGSKQYRSAHSWTSCMVLSAAYEYRRGHFPPLQHFMRSWHGKNVNLCPHRKAKRKKRYGASFVLVQPCSKHSFMIR